MQKDRQFRVSGNWALASDGVQWMLQHRQGTKWQSIKFIRSTKAHLATRMTQKGVPSKDAAHLLHGLPDTFDAWKAAQRGTAEPCHDDFEGEDESRSPEAVK